MEKYIYDNSNSLWYELYGNYYLPCLVIPEEAIHTIGIWQKTPALPQTASFYGLHRSRSQRQAV